MNSIHVDEEITLQPLENRHAELLFALTDVNRAHLRAWLPWLDGMRTVDDSRTFLATVQTHHVANTAMVTGIWYRNMLVGITGFNRLDWSNHLAEIGYWLGVAYAGSGIMTRCCRRLVDVAFNDWQLNRVTIECAVGNTRSCAIPHRLGFTHERTLRDAEWLYDHYVDHHVFAMLAREW